MSTYVACGKSLRSYQELCSHRKIHKVNADGEGREATSENPICETCGKEFKSYRSLKIHTNYVHRSVKCVCEICGKECKSPMSLYEHKHSHYDFERFSCSLCHRKFRFPTNFYKHRKVAHTNENAQIVKLIAKGSTTSAVKVKKSKRVSSDPISVKKPKENPEVHVSAGQVHNEASAINHSPPVSDAEESNVSNIISEPQDSTTQDNNSNYAMFGISSMELLIEDPPNFHSGSNISFSLSQEVDDDSANTAVYEKISEVNQCLPSCPSASAVTDSSRANNSPGATISDLEYQTELNDQNEYLINVPEIKAEYQCRQQNIDFEYGEYETFFSDEADDLSIKEASENEHELTPQIVSFSGNIKKENSCDDYLKESESNIINSFPLDPYSSQLIVKVKRLLEYNCTFCDKTFFMQTEREIRQHSRTHKIVEVSLKSDKKESVTKSKDSEQKKKHRYCLHCDKKNLNVEELIAHTNLEHPGLNAFKCIICSELFRTPDCLSYHKRVAHLGYRRRNPPKKEPKMDPNAEKEFLCEECGKAFHSKRSVQSHVLKVHKAQSRFTCEMCPLSFPTLWRLTRHTKRHTGEKSFVCDDCGRGFFEQRDLNDHINAVHLKAPRKRKKKVYKKKEQIFSFSCTICPERFLGEKALKVHMELHDPSRKFSCDVCGLRYKFSSNVITHKNLKHKSK